MTAKKAPAGKASTTTSRAASKTAPKSASTFTPSVGFTAPDAATKRFNIGVPVDIGKDLPLELAKAYAEQGKGKVS